MVDFYHTLHQNETPISAPRLLTTYPTLYFLESVLVRFGPIRFRFWSGPVRSGLGIFFSPFWSDPVQCGPHIFLNLLVRSGPSIFLSPFLSDLNQFGPIRSEYFLESV